MRVVIDTNLLISGSSDDFNYGNRIIDAVIGGTLEAHANPATLKENRLLVSQKIHDAEYRRKLAEYFSRVNVVDYLDEALDVVEDPEDNKLVESAVAARAEFLITSDKHLLKLESYDGFEIVTPEVFWNRLQDDTGSGWQDWKKQFMS